MAENKFRYSHDNCPVCNQQFQGDDDIVVCPICGTPHHRDCYKQNGACGNSDKHGENFRWEASTPVSDTPIKPEFKKFTEVHIKADELKDIQHSLPLSFGMPMQNPLGNFPTELEEGVSVEDVATFVQQDSIRYIQKFFYMKGGRKQWNWAAIFLAPYWFFYRKLYKHGAIIMALLLCLSFLIYLPPVERFANAMMDYRDEVITLSESDLTEEEYNQALVDLTTKAQKAITENKLGMAILLSQSLLSLAIVIYIGLNANKWYYNHIVKSIKDIRSKETDSEIVKTKIFKAGGVSYGAAFLSILAEKSVMVGFELILMMLNH